MSGSLIDGMDDQALDKATQEAREKISREIAQTTPLIGEKTPLQSLIQDFSHSQMFQNQIKILGESYRTVVKIRPDGNCFYRAFSFALFETLIGNEEKREQLKAKYLETRTFLVEKQNYPNVTVDDFYEQNVEFIDGIGKFKTLEELRAAMSDEGFANYIVCFLRLIASAELQSQPDFYMNFLPDVASIQDFCRKDVEPIGIDIDHVVITALSTGLSVPVRVACLEQREGNPQIIDFFNENADISLLFRPGHYDVLYK